MRANVDYSKLTPIEKVEYIQQLIAMSKLESLDRPVSGADEDDYVAFGNFVADTSPGPDEILAEKLLNEKLVKMVNTLRPRERIILTLRYGLQDGKCRTLEEIGKMYNITRERIRQIEEHAINKLRIQNGIKNVNDL